MTAWLSRFWESIRRPWARYTAPPWALALMGALYATTLQTDIGASNDPSPAAVGIVGPLMDDSGEFVVAWHTWGVAHPPGGDGEGGVRRKSVITRCNHNSPKR